MTSSSQSNPTFTNEYRLDAVRLAQSKGIPAAAKQLGISDSALRKWDKMVRERGESAFASHQASIDTAAELRRLREENRQLKMERDILKKAAAFFAKESE